MKHTFKKGLSWLLALVMCLGTLSGLSITADGATYSPIANWGQRGKVATELSEMAISFYESNGTDYTELSALSGASSTSSVPSSELYKELKSLMESNHTSKTNYEEIKDLCKYTDCENSNTGSMTCLYCGTTVSAEWDQAATWNREHTWPKSKTPSDSTSGRTEATDIVMLRPTCPKENSSRGNTAYGDGSSYYDPNLGSQNVHGDMARSVLFGYVRWGMDSYMWGTSGVIESVDVLLQWMEEDPVDTWELGRNDSVESITGTRNVFVDYPELAFALFSEEVPAGYQTPSGEGNAASYNITATSSNTSYGTVTLSGNTITATPKDGYYVTGYAVTSGTATVTRSDNTFKVSASSDCTVRINFAAKTAVTLTFMENGIATSTVSAYGGDAYTLPTAKNAPADGYDFIGWVTSTVDKTTEKPSVYTAGSSYTAANQTFYALYTCTESTDGETSNAYKLYSGDLVEGDYVIVYDGGAMKAADTDSDDRIDYADITVTNNQISTPEAVLIWHIAPTSEGYYTIYNSANNVYAAGNGKKNKAVLTTGVTDYAKWTASGSSVYEFVNLGNGNDGVNKTLRRNGTYGFACYSTSTGGALSLYKGTSGTTYYATDTVTCDHEDTTNVAAVAPTCTESGYSAGVYCNDCDRYTEGHEVVEATGHSYGDWVQTTAPTCTAAGVETQTCGTCGDTQTQSVAATGHSYEGVVTPPTTNEQGYTTYTCTVCGDSYVSDYVEALGEVYTVSFKVPLGVDAVADLECGKDGITLPTAGIPAGEQTYSFVGWSEEKVEDAETAPTLYKAGDSYTATADITLYAVYSYPSGSGTGAWTLVTDASALSAGDQLVIAANTKGYVAGDISSQYMTHLSASFSSDSSTVELPEGAVILTLGGSEGAWTLANTDGSLLGATAVKKLAWDSGTTAWSISISDSNATIQNGTSTYGRFLYNVTSPRFTTYTSSTNVNMLLPQLYRLDGSVTYTTEIGVEPAVAVYIGGALEAECATFEDALAYLGDSGLYLKLLQDVEAEVTLEDVLYLDLNGHSISGILEPDVYSVTVFDSSTDSYNGDNVGYFSCTDINDDPVVPARHIKTDVTGAVKRYMSIETESGYTFHRFYIGITHASVKPGTEGVGYKAIFAGDDAVKAQIGSYGMNLWVEGNEAYTATLSLNNSDFVSGKAVTVRVDNIDVENYAETPLNAQTFMTLTDGTEIESATVSMTLRQMVEKVNTNYIAYTSAQLAALKEMLDKYSNTTGWTTANIK